MTVELEPTHLPDTLSASNANNVVRLIVSQATGKTTLLNVDLSNVTHCDSAGLAALIAAKSHCQNNGIDVNYMAPTQQLLALANFLKVSTWFGVVE